MTLLDLPVFRFVAEQTGKVADRSLSSPVIIFSLAVYLNYIAGLITTGLLFMLFQFF
jgi:hypothetical protein